MSLYHIAVEMDEGWYCVHALEDGGIYTQGRTLDEAVKNVLEVIELVRGDKSPQLEIILPTKLKPPAKRPSGKRALAKSRR